MLRNLVENALKYGGGGLSEIQIGYKDFEKLAIKPEVRPLILKENAVKLLRLK